MRVLNASMLVHFDAKTTNVEELADFVNMLSENLDGFFLFTMGVIISLMQIGFGYLEAGNVNSKNATNVMFKNMMDSLMCAVVYWLIGFTLAFGDGNAFMGTHPYIAGAKLFENKQFAHWFFQISYASTPATIVSGAVVGRITFVAYIIYSALISGIVYPIVCHWAWTTQGWLYNWGYLDFCGSGVVHLTGGTCAIVAAVLLGARIGRFPPPGTVQTYEEQLRFKSHNTLTAGLGIMILYTGFFAFNGGSVLGLSRPGDAELVAKIMINTWLASSGGGIGCLIIVRTGIVDGEKRWSFLHAMNAGLAGMAATCAQANMLNPWQALLNGFCVSVVYCALSRLVPKLRVDDPVNVISVHFGGGLWGATGTTLLRSDSLAGGHFENVLPYLGRNIVGAISIITWASLCSILIFGSLKLAGLLRASPEDELAGADMSKHKEPAYQGLPCNHGENESHNLRHALDHGHLLSTIAGNIRNSISRSIKRDSVGSINSTRLRRDTLKRDSSRHNSLKRTSVASPLSIQDPSPA
ncbi:hypothetical protein B566_EDAN005103 [Ephemera danica]|nr:hypothetical protein B566_EDAN005103 [Ephemera danica]